MSKFIAVLQLLGSLVLWLTVLGIVHNTINIVQRPETISVVNALIGLGLLAVFIAATATVLFRRGRAGLRGETAASGPDSGSESG